MNIAILLPDLRGGGAERVMVDLAGEFARLGYNVEFVLMRAQGEFLEDARKTFSIDELGVGRVRFAPLSIARYLRCKRPAAVIANMWPLTSAAVIGRVLAGYTGRLLLVEHTTLSRSYASWGKPHAMMLAASMATTYRFADCVAAVSEGVAQDTARLARLTTNQVNVIHNPIPQRLEPDREARSKLDALWGCPPGRRILTVGALKAAKNHRLLVEAFANMQDPAARLMLLGQGEGEAALRDFVSALGIRDRVIFAGFQLDPTPFYATADLFVLSSDYEGLPTVLIEALSFGLPVVSTDCPSGPSEILENGRFGRLVPVGDACALSAAMSEVLESTVDREALTNRSKDFLPEIAARKYLDLLSFS